MSVTERLVRDPAGLVTVDPYRDIHKGIRADLFAVTSEAGRIDPSDHASRVALAEHVTATRHMLTAHAAHEDEHVEPVLAKYHPALASEITYAHEAIEDQMAALEAAAGLAVEAPLDEERGRLHHLYLDLARFTAVYLEHQEVEERTVLPALEAAIGPEAVREIDEAIVATIPPGELASGLSLMLPAMNIEDRSELLGGIQIGAPAEVFAGVWALTQSVLDLADGHALAARLGL